MNYPIKSTGSVFEIKNAQWNTGDERPETSCEISYDKDNYYLHFTTNETNLRSEVKEHNKAVCKDSCVEIFMQFTPDITQNYINFEVNCLGYMLAGLCLCDSDYKVKMCKNYLDVSEIESFDIKPQIHDDGWEISFKIPVSVIKKYFPEYRHERGSKIRANIYKYSAFKDPTHLISFNKILDEDISFHKPKYFADFYLD